MKSGRSTPRCWLLLVALAALSTSCASTPRPRVLGQSEAAGQSPAAQEAKSLAPQAYARAAQLHEEAVTAHEQGNFALAQVLGEHSLAAYDHAFVLTRYVRAERRLALAEQALAKAQTELSGLDEQHLRLTAEATALEMKIKVTVDKEPLGQMPPASAERLRARREAARALTSEARLLCLATELLDPKREGLTQAQEAVAALESDSADADAFVRATQARSSCLKLLTLVRRPPTTAAPEAGVTDRLFVELTESQRFFAFRDDRGIVVSFRDLVGADGRLTSQGAERLQILGRTAKAHPSFPLLVVAHTAETSRDQAAERQAALVAKALEEAGASRVRTHVAGTAQPVADGRLPEAAARNARLEIVFVSPAR